MAQNGTEELITKKHRNIQKLIMIIIRRKKLLTAEIIAEGTKGKKYSKREKGRRFVGYDNCMKWHSILSK